MKKQLLATAIAGLFVVPAVAQVTVSGTIDVAATASNKVTGLSATNAATSTTLNNTGGAGATTGAANGGGAVTSTTASSWSTSEIVFSGTEDLGGGLKATARFSQVITTGTVDKRDRVLGLEGGFGSVRLGRFTPAIGGLNAYSGAGTANQAGDLDHMSSGGTDLFAASVAGDFGRQDGLIQYSSPSFNGITVTATYGDNTSKTQAANSLVETKMQAIGAAYTAGPLKVEFASGERKNKTAAVVATAGTAFFFNSTNNSTVTQTTGVTTVVGASAVASQYSLGTLTNALGVVMTPGANAVTEVDAKHEYDWLGASYNLGPATLMPSHSRRKTSANPTTSSVQATTVDAKVNSVGVMIPMGATTFRLSGYTGKDERSTAATDDAKLSGQQVSATYALSKRTFIYAVMGEAEIKRDSSASTSVERKEKTSALGLVHNF